MSDDKKSAADLAAEVKAAHEKAINGVKALAEDALGKAKAGETLTRSLKETVDDALLKMNGLTEQVADLEQKAARHGPEASQEVKSLGQIVVENEDVKALAGGKRGAARVSIDRKAITSATDTVGTGVSAGTSLVPADRRPGIVAAPMRTLTIRNLLMPGQTTSGNVEYVQESGFTNNAAPVAENTTKPTSDLTFDLVSSPVRTIAHLFKASRQIMDDAAGLRSYIDGRARYGLQLKEEAQLLAGDGTGQNLLGLVPQATAFDDTIITVDNATPIDRLRMAILQAMLAEYPATGFVLHPVDWATIELTKDANNRYIIAAPQDGTTPRLWGLPVVETQSMAQGTFLTGAFAMGAQIFDRMAIEVLLSTENEDDFAKNMMTIRAEERLALAVYRPEAFVTGDVASGA